MSSQPSALTVLLHGLFDDASLFPPGDLPMPAAVAGYIRHHSAWYRDMTGPFVCPDTRIGALGLALTAGLVPEIDLTLVVTGGAAALEPAVEEVAADPRLRLRGVEVPVSLQAGPAQGAAELAAALDRTLLTGAAGYLEVPLADLTGTVLDVVAGHGYRPKLRTGGLTAAAFPGEDILAGCLQVLAERRLAFKCTAGLHHAVRQAASDTGFEHHGFLNVLLAVAAALDGASAGDIAAVLADQDPGRVADQAARLDLDQAMMVRSMFISFGTCSTDEPVADLVALKLADPGAS
jgi:hypothetical protein